MISEKQLIANKHNALKGGVNTEEGKTRSKYNALKHGIFKVVLTEYEDGCYEGIIDELLEQLTPEGFLETMLVERIALCYVRLFRIAKAEGEFMESQLHPLVIKRKSQELINKYTSLPYDDEVTVEGYRSRISTDAIRLLEQTLLRYDSTIENKLYKALHELQRLQATRHGKDIPPPSAMDVSVTHEEQNTV